MKLRASATTDIGCLRQENEDSHLCDDALAVYAVADGIGGLPGGAQASRCAVEKLEAWFRAHAGESRPDFEAALREASQAVFLLGREISPRHGIGTTLTLAHFRDGALHTIHVGDSFLFRVRDGHIEPLTSEHNVENELKARAARGEPVPLIRENRAALTRCVGQPPPLEGDFAKHPIKPGDRYLVCTDGITRCITPQEILVHLEQADTPDEPANALVSLANERGGLDNATAVVVFVD